MFYSEIQKIKLELRILGSRGQSSNALGKQWELFRKLFSPSSSFFFFSSGIFTLSRTAPGAIHYCVKVLVLRSGLEAE